MFWQKARETGHVRNSVQEDWIAWLPIEKRLFYEKLAHCWEEAYAMLSVSLNDAFSFREQGELGHARKNLSVAAELTHRFAEPLLIACQVLDKRGSHFPVPPCVAPLNPANFRTQVARHAAGWDQVLHRILFASRSRYSHKLHALQSTVANLAEEFINTAEEVSSGMHTRPEESWLVLDSLHYDLNTCLCETLVLLKSFLRVLPDAALDAVWKELNGADSHPSSTLRPRLSRASTY